MHWVLPRAHVLFLSGWLGIAGFSALGLAVSGCGSPEVTPSPSPTQAPNVAPTVKISAPANGAVVTAGARVNLSGSASDDSDSNESLTVTWSSSLDGELYTGVPDGAGKTTFSTTTLKVGTHTIELKATDSDGLSSSAQISLVVKSATNATPQAVITSPSSGAVFPEEQPVTFAGLVSDTEDAPATLSAQFRSSIDGPLGAVTPDSTGKVSLTVTLSQGAHDVYLDATDSGNATGKSQPVRVVIGSNLPPTVQFTGPDATRYNDGDSIPFTALVSDDATAPQDLILTWSSSLDGELSECDTPATSGGDVSCDISSLSVGTHVITLSVRDAGGAEASADADMVINGAPTGGQVQIQPSTPHTDDTLTAVNTQDSTDPNGDPVTYLYKWYRSGVLVGSLSTATVPETSTTRDEVWKVEVYPTDGELVGAAVSASVTILNTPPTLTRVAISPSSGFNSTNFFCIPQDFFDADGDSERFHYTWLVNGALVSGEVASSYIPTGKHPGDRVQCKVAPFDGTDEGAPALSPEVVLGNRAPSVVSAQVSPATGTVATTFSCEGSGWSDPDGDPAQYEVQWLINGNNGPTSATLTSPDFVKGDVISCRLTPFDGSLEGDSRLSASVTVNNAAPTVTTVAIQPSPAYADSTLRCQATDFSDPDGDPEVDVVDWKINGVSQSTHTVSLSSGFVRDDIVTCSVSVSDGTATPVVLTAAQVKIANAPPSITSVALSPPGGSAQTTFTALPRGYTDVDGDAAQYRYQWYVNGVASVTTASIAPGKFKTGDTLRADVTPFDGIDTGATASSATITVGSAVNPPSLDDVTLTPTVAYETTTFTCTPINPVDPEGDPITLAYSWSRNSTAIAGVTTSTLNGTYFNRDDVIQCTVTPRDASMTGAPVASNKVTVLNSKPSITKASVTPSPATRASSLSCTLEGVADADSDSVTVSFKWTVNGATAATTSSNLSPSLFVAGDTVSCSATPNDRLEDGTTVVSATVTVQNAAPVVGSVVLSPTSPVVSDTLSCQAKDVVDADGDTVSLAYQWYKGATVITGASASTLAASSLKKGDVITCVVTPTAASLAGAAQTSNAVTILNSAPTISSLLLEPDAPTETSTLTCTPQNLVDADNDPITKAYRWTVNGTDIGVTSSTLTGASFKRGDQVRCSLTATDSSNASVTATSNAVTVRNSSPVLSSVVLGPEPAYVTTILQCTPGTSSDADGDAIGFQYQWKVNGTTVSGVSTSFYSASTLKAGNTVQCIVTPVDDLSSGSPVASNIVTLANQPPVVTSVDLSPTLAYETTTLTCTANGVSDPDGDTVTLTYSWFVNGTKNAVTTKTMNGSNFNRGDEVQCAVTPKDSASSGNTVKSNSVAIENTVPTLGGATLAPTTAYEKTTLTCTGVAPSDVDPADSSLALVFTWLVDGSSVRQVQGSKGQLTDTLTGSSFNKNASVSCTVAPTDGIATGTAQSSNSVTILNTLPTVTGVAITPTSATVQNTLTCTYASTADDDNDTVTVAYQWKINGTVLPAQTASTLSGSSFKKGNSVTCVATPKDNVGSGTAVESSAVVIQNSAPVATSASLSAAPSPAAEASTLTCSASGVSDADSDTVSLKYAWKVNGSTVTSATSSTLVGADFNKGDSVTCSVTPNDGTVDGTAVTSSATIIQNTAPTVSTPTVTPAPSPARVGSTLTCSATGTDVDPTDTVSLKYAWTVNGTTVNGANSASLSSGFKKGDAVICIVTPNDGSADGTAKSSAATTIQNTAPVVSGVAISPTSPTVSNTLTCTVGSTSDVDNDSVTNSFVWKVNGTTVSGQTTNTLSGSNFKKSQSVTCEVTPTDGTASGTTVASSAVTILNAPPTVSGVTLTASNTPPKVTSTFTCNIGSSADPDNDTVTFKYAWTINGSTVNGATSSTYSGGIKKNDTVACSVTPNDGTVDGSAVSSNGLSVGNSSPVATTPTLTPNPAYVNSTISCASTGSDPDAGDSVTLKYAWTVDGTTVNGANTASLSTGFKKANQVVCLVTPNDGSADGTTVASAPLTISNTAPSVTTPVLTSSSTPAHVGSTMTCSATGSDLDTLDSVTLKYAWKVNGTTVNGATSSTLSSGFKNGDAVTCVVTPNDGTVDGTAKTSNVISIQNSAPTVSGVSISASPSPAKESSTLTCSAASTADTDGDTVTLKYAWTVDGSTVSTATSSTLTGSAFNKGDSVVCIITPNDGSVDGTPVASSAVTIGNSVPSASTPSLSPTTAYVTSTLTCNSTGSDADPADTVSLKYAWFINGSVKSGSTASTLSSGFVKGDSVHCTVTPNDGTADGTLVTSNSISILNSAPVATTPTLNSSSTPAVETSTLTCVAGTVSDADNDTPLTITYRWYIGSNLVNGVTVNSLDGTYFNKGDAVSCEVVPSDGTVSGSAKASNVVTISNSAPSIDLASISPTTAYRNSTLLCSPFNFQDADGDTPVYAYAWFINEVQVPGQTSATLSATLLVNDSVACRITPGDGVASGTAQTSSPVTILNRAPTLTSAAVSPTSANTTTTLTCTPSGYADGDGDAAVYTYKWQIDGVDVSGQTTSTLKNAFSRGDQVDCVVSASDGYVSTAPVTSNTVTIGNAPPTVSNIAITPSNPAAGEAMVASATGSDADGDTVTLSYAWKKNGTATSYNSATVPAGVTTAGEIWQVTVTPNDGLQSGSSISLSVTVTTSTVVDADGDGYNSTIDCDDTDPATNPGAHEFFDFADNDCDGQVDERWNPRYTYEGQALTPATAPDSTALAITSGDAPVLFFGARDLTTGNFASLLTTYSTSTGTFAPTTTIGTLASKFHRVSVWNRTGLSSLARTMVYDSANQLVRFVGQNDAGWQTELTVSTTISDTFGGQAMVTANTGSDYLFYTHFAGSCATGTTTFLRWRSRDPSTNALGSASDVTSQCGATQSLLGPTAVMGEQDAYLHLAWFNGAAATPRVDYRKMVPGGTSPSRVAVETSADLSQFVTIGLQPGVAGANPVIAYYDKTNNTIRKATTTNLTSFTPAVWITSSVTGGIALSQERIVMRVDSQGFNHIIFAANNYQDLWYATDRSGSLKAELIYHPSVPLNTRNLDQYSLVVDSNGYPYVSIPDAGTGEVFVLKGDLTK